MTRLERIGIDASRASSQARTGTEWYSWNIITALAAISPRPELELYFRDEPTDIHLPRASNVWINRNRLWTHVGLARRMTMSAPDALFVPAHVIPAIHPAATVVTIHDVGYRYEPGAHTIGGRLMLEATTRWNIQSAARIIVPSTSTARDLEQMYGVDSHRVDVIHHGLDHDRYRMLDADTTEASLSELGIRRPYLLFLSTIQPRKNLTRIVSAFEALAHPELQLVVAGKAGWKSRPIEDRIAKSAHSRRIVRVGYVPDSSVPALYNGAEAFVLPSLHEGFGMGVLEAMACGCPVVTSQTSSLAEVAGEAAVKVNPTSVRDIRDAIEAALNPACAAELRRAGLERARAFSWATAATSTLDSIQRAQQETRS